MNSKFALTLTNRISTKLLPLLMGAASLTLSAGVVPAAFAQSNPPDAPAPQQRMDRQNKLNLTAEQKQQMESIKQAEREQMNNILTAEQKARLEAAKQNGEDMRQVFGSLNITPEQQAQMQEVRRATKQQVESILTPEQLQQMQQYRQSRPNGNQTP